MYFKYLDLPALPDNLLLHSVEDFSTLQNIFRIPTYEFYKQYEIPNQELISKVREIFPYNFHCSYQLVKDGIAIHKDGARTECVNYLIDTGGPDATLNIFDDNKKLLHSEKILPKRWHWINVGMFHNVTNFSGTRIAITLNLFDYSFYQYTILDGSNSK